MQETAKIDDDEQAVVQGRAAARSVECFLEGNLSITITVKRIIVPHQAGVWVRPREVAFVRLASLRPLVRDRLIGIGFVKDQLGADVAALAGINAPQTPGPFAVIG